MYSPSYRTRKNGIPILSKLEIDEIAEHYISDFCPEAMNNPMEIDIDSFVICYLGLKQDFQYLSHCGLYLGMTVFNDTNKIPVYNPDTNTAEYLSVKARTVIIDNTLLDENKERRYRFTMGHEGSHDILHAAYLTYNQYQISFFDNEPDYFIRCSALKQNRGRKPVTQWDDNDRMEWQANYMSSSLLMPKAMVHRLVNSLPDAEAKLRDKNYVLQTAKTVNVSFEAALYRLEDLKIIMNRPQLSDLLAI